MSYPITACLVMKAARDEPGAYERFREAMRINLVGGHYTTLPCPHVPPCDASVDQLQTLQARLERDLELNPDTPNPAA